MNKQIESRPRISSAQSQAEVTAKSIVDGVNAALLKHGSRRELKDSAADKIAANLAFIFHSREDALRAVWDKERKKWKRIWDESVQLRDSLRADIKRISFLLASIKKSAHEGNTSTICMMLAEMPRQIRALEDENERLRKGER
jgi:hypothetical protein